MNKFMMAFGWVAVMCLGACGTVIKDDEATDKNHTSVDTLANLNAPQKAFTEANNRMHAGMGVIDKDADIAFIQGMIPHHQGAVDMANIILEHGDDEDAKELARNIITAQEEEIAWMKKWLAQRNLKPIDVDSATDHEAMGH